MTSRPPLEPPNERKAYLCVQGKKSEGSAAVEKSNGIPEEASIITKVTLSHLLLHRILLRFLVRCVASRVLPPQVHSHEHSKQAAHDLKRDIRAMPLGVMRFLAFEVEVRGHCAAEVSHADLQSHAHAALGAAADVVAVPAG